MQKFSSNYISCHNNYIININMKSENCVEDEFLSTYNVLQNILQRGAPTKPSNYLLSKYENYSIDPDIRYLSQDECKWNGVIKGYGNNNPAKLFYESILPKVLKGEYDFVKNLILPEALINEITGEENEEFSENAVDFYLPQCKLVIEIDGIQHKEEVNVQRDIERDTYLAKFNISVLRIPANSIRDNDKNLDKILKEIKEKIINSKEIQLYKSSLDLFSKDKDSLIKYSLDGIMRFQILILQLLKRGIISISDDSWNFQIKSSDIHIDYFVAIEDIFIWLENLLNLQGKKLIRPSINIKKVDKFVKNKETLKIDFSLLKRWDESINEDDVIFVRSDYLDEKDYFKVATSKSIKYNIITEGKESNESSLYMLNENIFGFSNFNIGQLPIIINSLSLTDTIGLLPTGSGKSLCYQLVCLLQPAISFVVVPIKSLMYDQKYNLDKKGIVHTNFVNSEQTAQEKEKILSEYSMLKYMFVWISPERFQTHNFRKQLRTINSMYHIGYAVIDEVHCLSEWGHDFRTSYLNLAKTINRLCPDAKFLGLTATASKNVLKDILVEFNMDERNVKTILDYTRKELEFRVIKDEDGNSKDKENLLFNLLHDIENKDHITKNNKGYKKCMLIFTPHVNGNYGCYSLSNKINSDKQFSNMAKYYSGEAPKENKCPIMNDKKFGEYKINVQNEFQENKFPIMVATKAFGMGVDKQNIRYTIHFGLPQSIESFYQEAGRAGRDKEKAVCYLLNSRDKNAKKYYDAVFSLESTIEDLNEINKINSRSSDDLYRNLFLMLSGNKTIKEECALAINIYENFCKERKELISIEDLSRSRITYNNNVIQCSFVTVQKAIYRLSLLGIIKDWTIEDWGNRGKFNIEYGHCDYQNAFNSLNKYIKKYDIEFDLNNNNLTKYQKYYDILNNNSKDKVYNLIYILIQWNYDNIFYSRRLSQKNLLDLCDSYYTKGKEYFKNTLEGYFKISDESFKLDHLVYNPDDFNNTYDMIFSSEENKVKNLNALEKTDVALMRFLESYRYNTSLNYLSGILALKLDKYNDKLVRDRFNSAFQKINTYDDKKKKEIFNKTIEVGKTLDEKNRDFLAEVLLKYIKKEELYDSLKDNVSLELILSEKVSIIKKLGEKINE